MDDFTADVVTGCRIGYLKSNAPCRGERVAKYNRLMERDLSVQSMLALSSGWHTKYRPSACSIMDFQCAVFYAPMLKTKQISTVRDMY